MKYEFHVGDYVETKNGGKGYVSNAKNLWWKCTHESDGYGEGYDYSIIGVDDGTIANFFNRIGQYDFTKKDEDKIEPLAEEYTKSFPIYKTTTTGNDSKCRSIDIGVVSKKINELVEAINELKIDYKKTSSGT